jgi:hypothetical protein
MAYRKLLRVLAFALGCIEMSKLAGELYIRSELQLGQDLIYFLTEQTITLFVLMVENSGM